MSCINPNNPQFKEILAKVGNPLLAEMEFNKLNTEDVKINSTIFEQNPNITEKEIQDIYDNYANLMNRVRADKEVPYYTFRSLLSKYQVIKYKNTYIFGNYDKKTGTFITRMNSSPTSKELLAEAVPNIVNQGIDVLSFVPKDYADKLQRSGYTISKNGFRHNFKGEDMIKYAATSNPKIFEKMFNKPFDEITGDELEDYNENLKLEYTPVEINSKFIKAAGNNTSKILEIYLSQFGIVSKDINEIQDKLKMDSLGFVDILNKIVHTKDKTNLPPLAGQFIAYMMQHNPLIKDTIDNLIQTNTIIIPANKYTLDENGKKKYNYKDLNKDEFFKYIGELIAADLDNKVKGEYNKSLIDKIKSLIKSFYDYLTNINIDKINKNIGEISNNILQQNKKLITASRYKPGAEGKDVKPVSIETALKKDTFGKDIIYKLSNEGFILTGSTALAEQGTILRPDENPLHDIDWVSPFTREETIKKFLKIYPDAIKVRDIVSNEGFVTDSYIIAPKNFNIVNYVDAIFDNKIVIQSYDVADKNGEIVGTFRLEKDEKTNKAKEVSKGKEAKVIDFFSYDDYSKQNANAPFDYKTKDGTPIKLANWRDIFKAKLNWARYKDVWDYNRFIPDENLNELNQEISSYIKAQVIKNFGISVPNKDKDTLIPRGDIEKFTTDVAFNKGIFPSVYYTGAGDVHKWSLNKKNLYDLVDKNTGEVYLKNIDLTKGTQENVEEPSTPVNEKDRNNVLNSLTDSSLRYGFDEILAEKGYDINDIISNLEAASTQEELNDIINKLLTQIC
jgi:hypothetical protein